MRPSWLASLSAFCLVSFLAPAKSAADLVVFEDGEFIDWSSEYLATAGASAEMTREATGGNPGACIDATTHMQPHNHVWLCMWTEELQWDPAGDGEIMNLSLEIDTRGVLTEADGQNLKLLVLQDERYYGGPFEPYVTATGHSTSWHTINLGPVASDGFAPLLPYQPTCHPDFTATGGPIRLGFMIGNSATGLPRSLSHLYDNWRVAVAYVGATPIQAGTWGLIKRHYR